MSDHDLEAVLESILAHGSGALEPGEAQLRQLLEGDREGPFHFVNLLAFKATAEYPEGHEMAAQNLSGIEAYDLYGAVALEQVTARGGRLMTLNKVQQTVVGDTASWDRVATMEYRNVGAFIEMLLDEDYQQALVHRTAGLEATQVFATRPVISEPIG